MGKNSGMGFGCELDLNPDAREPTTLNIRIKKWKVGIKVLARLSEDDEFQTATIINQGYKNGRCIGGYIIRLDSTNTTHVIGYEFENRLIKLQE